MESGKENMGNISNVANTYNMDKIICVHYPSLWFLTIQNHLKLMLTSWIWKVSLWHQLKKPLKIHYLNRVNWSLIKEQKQHNGAKAVFSTDGTGATRIHNEKSQSRHRMHTLPKY